MRQARSHPEDHCDRSRSRGPLQHRPLCLLFMQQWRSEREHPAEAARPASLCRKLQSSRGGAKAVRQSKSLGAATRAAHLQPEKKVLSVC